MRPTNLGFKSPREVCQAPHYNPTVTSKGAKLAYVSIPNKPVKQRPKSNLSSRFYEQSPSGNTSVFLGPGKYKDDYNSISHTIKSKVHAKYKGDMIDSRSSPYTYAGDAKVLDLAFLSPQARKAAYPYVITTSINLTSPKVGTPTSVGTLGNQSTAYSSFPHKRSPSNGSNGLKFQGQHHRTRSMQADGAKAPWEKILSSVGQGSGDQMLRTQSRKGSVELTKAQKDRNEQIYSQLVDSQLSKDLKSLKKELEGFQKKKVLRDTHMYDTKQNWSSTEGTETQKVTESEKEELETDKLTVSDKENGNGYIQIQEHIQAQEPRQEQEERRALVETSSNTCSLRGPDISFDGEGFITMNLASPKFGTNEFKSRQKEQKNLLEQKSFNKAIESKRKAVVTLANSSNVHSVSYHSRSGSVTSKAVRKI